MEQKGSDVATLPVPANATLVSEDGKFSAWISVDDSPLQVYGRNTENMEPHNNEQLSGFIPSEAGKVCGALHLGSPLLTQRS